MASFNYTFLRAWINATEIFNFKMNLNLDRQQVRRKYNDMKAKNRKVLFFFLSICYVVKTTYNFDHQFFLTKHYDDFVINKQMTLFTLETDKSNSPYTWFFGLHNTDQ